MKTKYFFILICVFAVKAALIFPAITRLMTVWINNFSMFVLHPTLVSARFGMILYGGYYVQYGIGS